MILTQGSELPVTHASVENRLRESLHETAALAKTREVTWRFHVAPDLEDFRLLADENWEASLFTTLFTLVAQSAQSETTAYCQASLMPGRRYTDVGSLLYIEIFFDSGKLGLTDEARTAFQECYEICRVHGGNLMEDSLAPQGTLLTLYLPRLVPRRTSPLGYKNWRAA